MTYVRPVSGPSGALLADLEPDAELAQLGDERAVALVGEPLGDPLGAVRADPLDLLDLLLARVEQPVDGPEVAREVERQHPADPGMLSPKRTREKALLRQLDRLDRVRAEISP